MLTRRSLLTALCAAPFAQAAARQWTLGANTAVEGYSLTDAIRLIRETGFPAIEIHPMGRPEPTPGKFPGFEFDKLSASARRAIRKQLSAFRVVTAHLPYTGLDHMAEDAGIRHASRRTVEIAMEGAAFFGAARAVLHAQPIPEEQLAARWQEYMELYGKWADKARSLGFEIAMETGYPRSIAGYVKMIQQVNHPSFGATIDVGHQARYAELTARVKPEQRSTPEAIRAYNDTTIEIVERLARKVLHLHVHDIDPNTWQEHKPMVHGFVDYGRLFATLRKVDYRGILMFEIGGPASEMRRYLTEGKAKLALL
ncbi:MAG: sugar phosphate isomerase/epimerase family protein [Bryobacteraceae bacterium]|nr:sugar phosphate isomerase/epimerase family protein [Bryobacteraceae bacterium]